MFKGAGVSAGKAILDSLRLSRCECHVSPGLKWQAPCLQDVQKFKVH